MEENSFESVSFLPVVKNISPRTIGMDIFPYIPGDHENMRKWDEMMRDQAERIKSEFGKKGISMPKIVIDSLLGPITYAIRTVDQNGNIIHSQK